MVTPDAIAKLRLSACVATADRVLHPIPHVYEFYGVIVEHILRCDASSTHEYKFLREGTSLLW